MGDKTCLLFYVFWKDLPNPECTPQSGSRVVKEIISPLPTTGKASLLSSLRQSTQKECQQNPGYHVLGPTGAGRVPTAQHGSSRCCQQNLGDPVCNPARTPRPHWVQTGGATCKAPPYTHTVPHLHGWLRKQVRTLAGWTQARTPTYTHTPGRVGWHRAAAIHAGLPLPRRRYKTGAGERRPRPGVGDKARRGGSARRAGEVTARSTRSSSSSSSGPARPNTRRPPIYRRGSLPTPAAPSPAPRPGEAARGGTGSSSSPHGEEVGGGGGCQLALPDPRAAITGRRGRLPTGRPPPPGPRERGWGSRARAARAPAAHLPGPGNAA